MGYRSNVSISSSSPSSRRVGSDPRLGELIAGDAVIDHRLPDADGLESFSARRLRGARLLVRFLPPEFASAASVSRMEAIHERMSGVGSVARVVDSSVTVDGLPYLAYELEGETLEDYIAHAGPLNIVDALYLTLSLAQTIADLHARGIAHGHLTPANVLRTDFGELLILDVGLAALSAEVTPPLVSLLSGSQIVGNPSFMAPELIGRGSAGAEADVYGVGAILYFLLTGSPPFDGADDVERAKRVTAGAPPRLSEIVDSATTDLEALFTRVIVKEPALRVGTAAELVSELKQVCRRSGSRVFEYERRESGLAPRPIELKLVPQIPKAPRLPSNEVEPPASPAIEPARRSRVWSTLLVLALLVSILGVAYLMLFRSF